MANDSKTLELQIRVATREAIAAVSSLKGDLLSLASEADKLSGSGSSTLGAAFQGAQAEAEKAAISLKLFGASGSELRQVQAKLKTAAVDLVTQGFHPQSVEVQKLIDEYKRLGQASDKLNEATGQSIDSFGQLKNALGSLAEVAALAKTLTVIKDMGVFALQTADTFQTARNQFGTLLGDMEAGAGLFNQIKDFNDKTPFDLNTLTQATNVLITAKVPLEDLQNQLTKFGDLSQGNSQKFTSYINAFSKAAAKGKADMEILNTYINQGVPILDALAKNFNVTTEEIVEMTSQGKVSFADFSNALDTLTAAGGQYFGGMELGSQSLSAMQEGLKESINSLAASFGEVLLPSALAVFGALTDIFNAINDSPIAKGILAGALVMLTGFLAAMAVKATMAFVAQMNLNFAVGVMNPVVMASTIVVATLAAGYTILASDAQKAARETENLARKQREQQNTTQESLTEVQRFHREVQNYDIDNTINAINRLQEAINEQENAARQQGGFLVSSDQTRQLRAAVKRFEELRSDFIKEYYNNSTSEKIQELQNRISIAQKLIVTVDISAEDKSRLEAIISEANAEIDKLNGDINAKARQWKTEWAETWNKFQAEQANNPFYDIELERKKTLEDAYQNYVRSGNQETLDQVNAYYDSQRNEVIRRLADEEARTQRELSRSKIDDLEYEKEAALKVIEELRDQRIFAAAYTGEDIQAIREKFQAMMDETGLQFDIRIEKTALDEAREAVKDWQQEIADSLTLALINIEGFSSQAAVALGDLTAQLIALSVSTALSGFEEFGRALGEGKDGLEALGQAFASMAQQILRQLPMMFLQAGLQLIANGQWALGLGFIAAAGSSAIISGYVDGTQNAARAAEANAHGGVYDEYGRAARAFASGGAFTNQIVSNPTYFRHGGGLGLMGEAGPEAIMPLKRMPSGNLGVETEGGGARVTVNIINNSGATVRREERHDENGGKQIDVIIGEMVNRHISSGKADHIMSSRYGTRAAGV